MFMNILIISQDVHEHLVCKKFADFRLQMFMNILAVIIELEPEIRTRIFLWIY